MAEFDIRPAPALTGSRTLLSGEAALHALPEGHVLQVIGAPGVPDLTGQLLAMAEDVPFAVRRAGPGHWFIVGDAALSPAQLDQVSARAPAGVAISDQSHGRVRIGVQGGGVTDVLARFTALDLDLSVFPVGQSAITLMGHISAHVTRVAPDAFEIMVLRSFAETLWREL